MLGISLEHILIVFVILLIFGPTRLPQAGAYLGKAVRNFKEQWKGVSKDASKPVIEAEFKDVSDKEKAKS